MEATLKTQDLSTSWRIKCQSCGRLHASASSKDLLPDYSYCDCDKEKYYLTENAINGTVLHYKIFDQSLHEYYIVDRLSLIDDLILWIGEANKSKNLMKEDLKMLMNLDDEYIFSSCKTNSYISSNDSDFDNTCIELLHLNKTLNKTT